MAGPRRNRLVIGTVLSALVLVACGSSGRSTSSHPSSTMRASTTTSSSTTASTSSTSTTSTTGGTPTTRAPSGPAAVSTLQAVAGGGSGEILLSWSGVPGATGYRVGRAVAASGPFTTVADVNAASGTGSHTPSVVNLYLAQGRYVLVDVPTGSASRRWYYVVTATSGGATAPPSAVVCGAPPGSSCS